MASAFFLEDSASTNLLIKLPGTRCNLTCDYCYEHMKGITDVPRGFVMPSDVVDFVRKSDMPINIVFHGGEPLLASVDYFSAMLSALRPLKEKIKAFQIQTNGTLINQRYIDLFWKKFADLSIEISVSLDGNAKMNSLRKSCGHETFSQVVKAFDLLNQNGISAGVLSVIHKDTLSNAQEYIEFIASIPNVRFVKLNPLHLVDENGFLQKNSISPTEFSKFVIDVFSHYLNKQLFEKFPIEPCLSILQVLSGVDTHYCNFSKRKCHNFICLYPDTTMSICDSLPYSDFLISSMQERHKPLQKVKGLIEACSNCEIKNFCKGGCIGIRYLFRQSPELQEEYCKSKKMLYNYFSQIVREVN